MEAAISNPFKAIGKVFKKIVRVVKKIALPALAIGAAVLTGGAALGLGGIFAGGIGGLGLSTGLTAVLTTAGQGALLGMGTAALTGKSILKGATSGFVTGAAFGGINQAIGGIAKAGSAAAGAGNTSMGMDSLAQAGRTAGTTSLGMDSLTRGAMAAAPSSSTGFGSVISGVGNAAAPIGGSVAPGISAISTPPAMTTSPVEVVRAGGGGFGAALQNPTVLGNIISGAGQGISNYASQKAASKDERRRYEQRQANYADTSGYFRAPTPMSYNGSPQGYDSYQQQQPPPARGTWQLDPITQRPVLVYG